MVFGVGSPFGDDTLGWQAIDLLQEDFADRPGVELIKLAHPHDACSHSFAPDTLLIFADATDSGAAPGTVQQFTPDQLEAVASSHSSHGLGLKAAIDLLVALGHPPQAMKIFGIEMDSNGHVAAASSDIAAGLKEICIRIKSTIEHWQHTSQ